MRQWCTTAKLAGMPGMPGTERAIQLRAKRENWQRRKRAGRGGGWEYHIDSLPAETRTALVAEYAKTVGVAVETPSANAPAAADWKSYEHAPDSMKGKAKQRATVLAQLAAMMEAGVSQKDGIAKVIEEHGVHRATVFRWLKRTQDVDANDRLPALMSRHHRTAPKAECSAEAWETFKADYLRLEAPAAAACYERLVRTAIENEWQVPSCARTLTRRIQREIPREVILLAREGAAGLQRCFPAQRRDHSVFRALEAVNADGHKFDVFVRWPDGEIRRPLMVAWQDIYSGKFLSYRVDYVENAASVRLAFGDLVEEYGLPDHAYLDNGRAFASKWITGGTPNRYRFKVKEEEPAGLLTVLGVTVHWVTPYHGQAKPIERAFRDLCEYVAKHPAFAGAYTGNNPTAKPENYGSKAIPLATFLEVLDQEVLAHNARRGRRSSVAAGGSFDAAFNASYAQGPVRKTTEEQNRMWLLAAESMKGHRSDGSVRILDNVYWSEELTHYAGEMLVVRFDPEKLHGSVHVYQKTGEYIGKAECIKAVGFADTDAAAEWARDKARRNKAAKAVLKAERRMSATEVASQLPAVPKSETPTSEVIHLTRPQTATRPNLEEAPRGHDMAEVKEGARLIQLDEQRRRAEQEDKDRIKHEEREQLQQYLAYSDRDPATLSEGQRNWMDAFSSDPEMKGLIEFEMAFAKMQQADA